MWWYRVWKMINFQIEKHDLVEKIFAHKMTFFLSQSSKALLRNDFLKFEIIENKLSTDTLTILFEKWKFYFCFEMTIFFWVIWDFVY